MRLFELGSGRLASEKSFKRATSAGAQSLFAVLNVGENLLIRCKPTPRTSVRGVFFLPPTCLQATGKDT